MGLNHPNLMKLMAYSSAVNKDLCSTTYTTKAFYEFPRTDLQKELADRSKEGQDFNHIELTHMAYQCLLGLHSIHERGLAHGDIRPQLIGYDKANNHFEIMDRLSNASLIERYQGIQMVNGKEIYQSPEFYKKLKGKDKTTKFDYMKNDIFALGLTILYIGTGNSIQNIYLPDGEIERRLLHEHVMNFDMKYGEYNPFLCNLLKTLLQTRDSDRPDTELLFRNMPSYEEFKRSEAEGDLNLHISQQQSFVQTQPVPIKETNNQNNYYHYSTTTTNVKSTPQQLDNTQTYHYSPNAPVYHESKVINTQSRYVQNGNKNMQFHNAETYFDANGNKMIRRSYGHENKVEVRRGSPSPIPGEARVIKKRYVMREDGTVVEIDPNVDLNSEEIRKYFNRDHNEHTIAQYDNVNQAIKSENKYY